MATALFGDALQRLRAAVEVVQRELPSTGQSPKIPRSKWNKRQANPTHSHGDCAFWFCRIRSSVPSLSYSTRTTSQGQSPKNPHSAFRDPHFLLPSPVAPALAELTYESARFFGENLFAERLGGVTQFSAFSVQTADDTFHCFGTTKSLRRFPQQSF
jgi:hypothetical protein